MRIKDDKWVLVPNLVWQRETAKAVCFVNPKEPAVGDIWIPKSQLDGSIIRNSQYLTGVPRWLANERNLMYVGVYARPVDVVWLRRTEEAWERRERWRDTPQQEAQRQTQIVPAPAPLVYGFKQLLDAVEQEKQRQQEQIEGSTLEANRRAKQLTMALLRIAQEERDEALAQEAFSSPMVPSPEERPRLRRVIKLGQEDGEA